jgi:hypothetical protein
MRRSNPAPNSRASRAIHYSATAGAESGSASLPQRTHASRHNMVSYVRQTSTRRQVDLDLDRAKGGSRRGVDVSLFVHRRAGEFRVRSFHRRASYDADGYSRELEHNYRGAEVVPIEEERFTVPAGQLREDASGSVC